MLQQYYSRLGYYNITYVILSYGLRWAGHVVLMTDSRLHNKTIKEYCWALEERETQERTGKTTFGVALRLFWETGREFVIDFPVSYTHLDVYKRQVY